ncbi:hypothetical protein QBC42DRAFT_66435 [Cladorrhinum samala]|uniref:Uncharacterized protein n=1 Tax=Cladorrhinum samala TaxID=585594 RepID=A0AAV9HUK3_9PEZI|nr:hypothetical protein QBC42DRAFT_66435 [Cladorrhinum samala]
MKLVHSVRHRLISRICFPLKKEGKQAFLSPPILMSSSHAKKTAYLLSGQRSDSPHPWTGPLREDEQRGLVINQKKPTCFFLSNFILLFLWNLWNGVHTGNQVFLFSFLPRASKEFIPPIKKRKVFMGFVYLATFEGRVVLSNVYNHTRTLHKTPTRLNF